MDLSFIRCQCGKVLAGLAVIFDSLMDDTIDIRLENKNDIVQVYEKYKKKVDWVLKDIVLDDKDKDYREWKQITEKYKGYNFTKAELILDLMGITRLCCRSNMLKKPILPAGFYSKSILDDMRRETRANDTRMAKYADLSRSAATTIMPSNIGGDISDKIIGYFTRTLDDTS